MTTTTTETRPDVSYTSEGGGVVATCTGCGWEAWRDSRVAVEAAAAEHKKCRPADAKRYTRNTQLRAASRQSRNPIRLTSKEG